MTPRKILIKTNNRFIIALFFSTLWVLPHAHTRTNIVFKLLVLVKRLWTFLLEFVCEDEDTAYTIDCFSPPTATVLFQLPYNWSQN